MMNFITRTRMNMTIQDVRHNLSIFLFYSDAICRQLATYKIPRLPPLVALVRHWEHSSLHCKRPGIRITDQYNIITYSSESNRKRDTSFVLRMRGCKTENMAAVIALDSIICENYNITLLQRFLIGSVHKIFKMADSDHWHQRNRQLLSLTLCSYTVA